MPGATVRGELVVNVRTEKRLGLPPSLPSRADRVIESRPVSGRKRR